MGVRKKYDLLPEIPYGTRPRILLVGNGTTLSFSGSTNTDSIIKDEWINSYNEELPDRKDTGNPHVIWTIPFPLQVVAATNDHVQSCMSKLACSFNELEITEDQKDFILEVLNTRFDSVLTTNYSLEFEKSTISKYTKHKTYSRYKVTQEQTTQQKLFGIYQCTKLDDDNQSLLWHIHGTALRKQSMIIGQYYYGKLMSEVTARANTVNKSYKTANEKKVPFRPLSWIDYFLIGDVYILGLSLDFSETGLWWLLSLKKRGFPDSKVSFYNPKIDEKMALLFRCYNINTPNLVFSNDYIEYYKKICKTIEYS